MVYENIDRSSGLAKNFLMDPIVTPVESNPLQTYLGSRSFLFLGEQSSSLLAFECYSGYAWLLCLCTPNQRQRENLYTMSYSLS